MYLHVCVGLYSPTVDYLLYEWITCMQTTFPASGNLILLFMDFIEVYAFGFVLVCFGFVFLCSASCSVPDFISLISVGFSRSFFPLLLLIRFPLSLVPIRFLLSRCFPFCLSFPHSLFHSCFAFSCLFCSLFNYPEVTLLIKLGFLATCLWPVA